MSPALPSVTDVAQPEHLSGDERPEFSAAARGFAQVVQQLLQAYGLLAFVVALAVKGQR